MPQVLDFDAGRFERGGLMISNRSSDIAVRMTAAAASLLVIGAFVGCGQGQTGNGMSGGTHPPVPSQSTGAAGSFGAPPQTGAGGGQVVGPATGTGGGAMILEPGQGQLTPACAAASAQTPGA